jgi:hypothetical protein
MRLPERVMAIVIGLTLALPLPFFGAGEAADTILPVYKPPTSKMPGARVGGVMRGSPGKDPYLVALVPDHIGLTHKGNPVLHWYISQTTTLPLIFTLREELAVRPVLEERLKSPDRPGVQMIRLKDFGVELKEEVSYRWYVSVQRDPEYPSQDIVTGGAIQRVAYVDGLIINMGYSGPRDPLHLYADAGLWYDALTAICEQIEALPGDQSLRRQRAALLQQVGLAEIAVAMDRN